MSAPLYSYDSANSTFAQQRVNMPHQRPSTAGSGVYNRIGVVGGAGGVPATYTNNGVYTNRRDNTSYMNAQQQFYVSQGYQNPPTLREWFMSVDTNRSGTIDANELVMALRKGRINITLEGAARLIALFDTRGTRQIDYEQFKNMHPFIDSMTKGFKKRDLTGDGYLQMQEVNAALVDSGHRVSAGCLQTIMMKFDSGQRGVLSFDDYVALSIFIACVKSTFANIAASSGDNSNGGQQALMDFYQFISACIVCK